ncbi:alcohol dehydrogenase [Bifidobacterium miconisargentati]|uniref:alcohol dehydrogenase n=1 Tax=Bifidobacterium miconisargentati TaxID=2834437 RepID=UPI001BDCE46C|nr:alcohol dehydrogenase [Bifidobacterium miconisargentati]MBW3089800.1 alcohol dehydrogenase [Bifidobacterium miconisargentati]
MGINSVESLPWSHRRNALVRSLITMLAGAFAAFIGTFAHRMGASADIPYGLALAFLLIILSTWCARARLGAVGLALHLITSSATAWGLALATTSGNALIVAGFQGDMPFFSQHAGYIWLYGIVLVQVVMLVLPARWFTIPPRDTTPQA